MKHMRQPRESSVCGQTCVAMILGISLEKAINLFQSRGGTRTKQLIQVLRDQGYKTSDQLIRIRKSEDLLPQLPDLCIVKVHFDDARNTHWVVFSRGEDCFFDPSWPVEYHAKSYASLEGQRITSYLEIKENGEK